MNILIDIGHPAHVHLFKHFAWAMLENGHEIFFTCREKEFEIYLLEKYGFRYKSFGKKFISLPGKLFGLLKFDLLEFIQGLKSKPDILLSHGSMYAAHAAFLLRRPHISFEDTFNMEQVSLYLPFTKVILTGKYPHPELGNKEIQYAGYHELLYLHPNIFGENRSGHEILKLDKNDKYILIRFVSWQASHDKNHSGFSIDNKIKTVNEFSKFGKVFISSESVLPSELSKFKIEIDPNQMHNVIASASLIFGESATMISEGAVLGIPGIYLDDTGRYYTNELEKKYELIFNYTESIVDQLKAIEKGIEILNTANIMELWQKKRRRMLSDKINVTAFLIWFVENYPKSVKVMKENPDYQYNFK